MSLEVAPPQREPRWESPLRLFGTAATLLGRGEGTLGSPAGSLGMVDKELGVLLGVILPLRRDVVAGEDGIDRAGPRTPRGG